MALRRTTSSRSFNILLTNGHCEVKLYARTSAAGGRRIYYKGRRRHADTSARFTFLEIQLRAAGRVTGERLHSVPFSYVRCYSILGGGVAGRAELEDDVKERLRRVAARLSGDAVRHIVQAHWRFMNEAINLARLLGHRAMEVNLALEVIAMVPCEEREESDGAPVEASPQEGLSRSV